MIHPTARKAVGWICLAGGLEGHAVLVGPRHCVTCAHVLTKGPAQPAEAFKVVFPNLGLDIRATVVAWRAYDPHLAPGSDLAVLEFADGPQAPPGSWVRLDESRPREGDDVVTLDFQTGRPDGDCRAGRVHDPHGAVVSVTGDHFLEKGLSGTGLFYAQTGDRLLGLASGMPPTPGQTAGYVIPADRIAPLLAPYATEAAGAEAVPLAFDTDEARKRFANRRAVRFDLLAPSQTARPGAGVTLEASLGFDQSRAGAEQGFAEVELHLASARPVTRQCGTNVAVEVGNFKVEARMGENHFPSWRISRCDGSVLVGGVEISVPPLCVIADAVEGDTITGRLTAFASDFKARGFSKLDISEKKQKIIDRLQLREFGEPDQDGDILLGEVSGQVRLLGK